MDEDETIKATDETSAITIGKNPRGDVVLTQDDDLIVIRGEQLREVIAQLQRVRWQE